MEDLKRSVQLQIEDTIETLQLRILLNQQSLGEEIPAMSELNEAIRYYKTVKTNEGEAEEVIEECNNAISKLKILRDFLPRIPLGAAVSLFNNYERYGLEGFQQQLNGQMNRQTSP